MAIDGVWIPIIMFSSVPIIAIGLPIARAYARRVESGATRPVGPGDMTARLERIEQAVDAIAVEVERISEGQRFTTKLLADRGATPPLPADDPGPR
jgi:hypothetical protein